METTYQENRAGLKLKFAIFYLLSVGLILFIVSLFVPYNTASGSFSTAKPIGGDADLQSTTLLNTLETINAKYRNLKVLDQEFAQEGTSATDAQAANQTLQAAEISINNSLDSIGRVARSLTDRKATLQLQNFTESYRLALSDRAAMRVYKIAALTSGKPAANKDAITQMQTEITARDKRIAELQNQNYSLEQRTKTLATNSNSANQQAMDALRATISDQEKKIANLNTINAALEKQNAANGKDLDLAKKSTDNGTAALKSQNALLEKRVADLTAEVRLAQVDCNLTRADASQIISSSKQRKNLLSDALGTLNNLSANGDPAIKKKVADKIVRLNQVASTVHD